MLVLRKILGLFVNTLSEDDRYCLLYKDNLLQPIQILLSQKQKTFSQFFSAFLKSALNFEHFQKKINLIADVFPKLPSAKKVIRSMPLKSRFRGLFSNKHGKRAQRLLKSATTLTLPYLLVPVKIIQFGKIYVSALENLTTVC